MCAVFADRSAQPRLVHESSQENCQLPLHKSEVWLIAQCCDVTFYCCARLHCFLVSLEVVVLCLLSKQLKGGINNSTYPSSGYDSVKFEGLVVELSGEVADMFA